MKKANNTINYPVYLFLASILVVLLLILASCGGNDEGVEKCKKSSDCKYEGKSEEAFTAKCVDKKCEYVPKKGVCGNGKCDKDAAESFCSCPEDCSKESPVKGLKKCEGKVGKEEFLQYSCNKKNECVVEIVGMEVQSKIETIKLENKRAPQADIFFTPEYPKPFNMDTDLLKLKFRLDKKYHTDVDEVTVTRIQVTMHTGQKNRQGKLENDKPLQLVDKLNIDRILWDPKTEAVLEFPINAPINQTSSTTFTLKVFLSYKNKESKDTELLHEQQFDREFVLVKTTNKPECIQASCDDKNPCTEDKCVASKGYCDHIIGAKQCKGNFKCDSGESKCNAPEDCGDCSGDAGEFTEYQCNTDKSECEAALKKGKKQEEIVQSVERKLQSDNNPEIRFEVVKKYMTPFKGKSDKFKLNLLVLDIKNTTQNFAISNIQLLDDTALLGSLAISKTFSKVGDTEEFAVKIDKNLINTEEKYKKLKFKVKYSYTGVDRQGKEQQNTNLNYEEGIGEVLVINSK